MNNMIHYSLSYAELPLYEDRLKGAYRTANLGSAAIDYSANEIVAIENEPSQGEVVVIGSGSIHPLADLLDQHRAKYVRDMGWMPGDHATDFDKYDDPAEWTFSFVDVIYEDSGENVIISSLRLTRLDQLDDCMSLKMANVKDKNELPLEALAKITKAEEDGALYDLTRLLPPSKKVVSTEQYFQSVVKLIGYGVEHTAIEPDADPVWLFATTAGLHTKLERLGMPNETIAACQRPGEARTVLCMVKPLEALAYISDNRKKFEATFRNVQRGIIEAGRTLSV